MVGKYGQTLIKVYCQSGQTQNSTFDRVMLKYYYSTNFSLITMNLFLCKEIITTNKTITKKSIHEARTILTHSKYNFCTKKVLHKINVVYYYTSITKE